MRPVSDAQVRRLMQEMSGHGQIGRASRKADMDRKTARKYVRAGKLPSQMSKPRAWRTRADPFDEDWAEIEARLKQSPTLQAKALFEWLTEKHPRRYDEGQLRTLQRHIQAWRAQEGPEKEVVFGQQHRPGEAAQTDFTWATELGVTIGGSPFAHMLCVVVLPYSNWRWATVCHSESLMALRRGVQRALFQLGRVPEWHQTDNSTAATHRIPEGKSTREGERRFNEDYVAMMRHFGMKPRTTRVGAKEQNGDVEAANGALKRALEQALLLRESRDFDAVEAWQAFIDEHLRKANAKRAKRVSEELAHMRELNALRLPEFTEESVRVTARSMVRVKYCAYSLPSRLIGEWVKARIFEDKVEFWHGGKLQLECPRVRDGRHRIDYRHVIWSLVRKPGAFARYAFRDELFPSLEFRRAYDAIQSREPGTAGDLAYLRILHLAASTLECDVQAALALLLAECRAISVDAVKDLVSKNMGVEVPSLQPPVVDLLAYDALLAEVGT